MLNLPSKMAVRTFANFNNTKTGETMKTNLSLATLLLTVMVGTTYAIEIPTSEWESMKLKIAALEAKGEGIPATTSMVDKALDTKQDNKYGPGANVTSKSGKLQLS